MLKIIEDCRFCSTNPDCVYCNGTKIHERFRIQLPENVFYSHVVLECIDPTEHQSLTGKQKDDVLTILSCGLVDLNDGKAGKVRLWNWFGSESTTVASLTALLE